jgi:hypothetical protein
VSTSKQSLGVSGRGIIQSFRHPGPGRSSAEPSPLIDGDRAWHGTAGRPHLSPSPSPRGQRRTRAVVIALPTGECGPRRYSDKAPGPTRHGRRGARAAAAFRENTRMPSHRQLIIDHREGRRGFAGSGKALLALFQLQFLPWRRIPIRLPTLPPEPAVRACTTLAKVKASSEAVGTPAARHTGINVD